MKKIARWTTLIFLGKVENALALMAWFFFLGRRSPPLVLMEFNLKKILLVLLHSTGEPITPKEVQKLCARYRLELDEMQKEADGEDDSGDAPGATAAEGDLPEASSGNVPSLVTQTEIREAFLALQAEAEETQAAYRILEGPSGFQITCPPDYAPWVRLLRGAPTPLRLSPAALETLSIVAYRQPVTRAEMEAVRGVSVDGPLNRLLEFDLVHVAGRSDLPGRPLQYGTTDKFLDFVGVTSLESLPASDVLSNREVDAWLRQLNAGEDGPDDDDVGLPMERRQDELPLDETYVELPRHQPEDGLKTE